MLTADKLHIQVEEITALARLEIELIAQQKWDEIESLEQQRKDKLRKTFDHLSDQHLADDVRSAVKKLKALEDEIQTLLINAKEQTQKELQAFSRGNKATQSYHQTRKL